MPRPSKTPVGVIGLGIIGSRAAANLRKAGYQVFVWNRSPRPEPNFLSSPVEIAESARIIQIFVSDGAALLEVVRAIEPALTPAHTILNHATVSPDQTRQAAQIVEDRHAKFLDAPFTGSKDAAANAALVFLVGAESSALAAVKPVLEVNAQTVLELGPVGSGTALKIATNLMAAVSIAGAAEALALLAKQGVALQRLPEVLAHHGVRSDLIASKVPRMILDDFDPHFALKHMFKDVQIALDTAAQHGIDLPEASAFAGAALAGLQRGWADLDYSVLARLFGFPDREAPLDDSFRPSSAPSPADSTSSTKRRGLFGLRQS
ncbi:MAG: NAD(P)-dependent oxidoreductase [Terrimicrobiaceae bacterium]